MFNSYNWGGYLIWALPDYKVSQDGRAELYVDLIEGMRTGRGYEIFRRAGVRFVLTETDGPLARALVSDPAWRTSYKDETATVLTKATSP